MLYSRAFLFVSKDITHCICSDVYTQIHTHYPAIVITTDTNRKSSYDCNQLLHLLNYRKDLLMALDCFATISSEYKITMIFFLCSTENCFFNFKFLSVLIQFSLYTILNNLSFRYFRIRVYTIFLKISLWSRLLTNRKEWCCWRSGSLIISISQLSMLQSVESKKYMLSSNILHESSDMWSHHCLLHCRAHAVVRLLCARSFTHRKCFSSTFTMKKSKTSLISFGSVNITIF